MASAEIMHRAGNQFFAGSGFAKNQYSGISGSHLLNLAQHTNVVLGVSFSPDGTRLASGSVDGTVRVYALRLEELVALAQERVTRSLTDDECRRYLHLEACPAAP